VDVPAAGDDAAAKAYAAAMAAPEPDEPEMPAPPARDPEAPYGRTKDGKPKRGPGGRPPKAEQPRVQATKGRHAKAARDYRRDLTGIVQLGWGALAMTSPADAGALKLHGPRLVEAVNDLAQENAKVAAGIEWLTTGSTYGAVVMVTVPLILQVMANHGRLPYERVAALGVRDPEELAEVTMMDVQAMAQAAAA
jgi:hypothetical protein